MKFFELKVNNLRIKKRGKNRFHNKQNVHKYQLLSRLLKL